MKKILFLIAFLFTIAISAQTVVGGGNVIYINQVGGTDDQALSLVGNTLTLEDGGTVDLSPYLDNTDDFVVSGIESGGTLTLTMDSGDTVVIDLSGLEGGSTSLSAGTNVTITGTGTEGDPYVINASGSGSITVVDNLLSNSSSDALSANQGRILKDQVDAVSASGQNPNIAVANSLSDITNAGAGATVEIRSDIVLTADFTPPANQKWIITTGSIDRDSYTIYGNNTSWEASPFQTVFFSSSLSGTIEGTWNPPNYIHSTHFGFVSDGRKFQRAGNITTGTTTLTVTGGDFTDADVGNFISIYSANSNFSLQIGTIDIPSYLSENSHITTIASVTNSTTVELATPVTANATNVDVWTGTDNFNAGRQMIYMRNQKSGNIVFDPGAYFRSRADEPISGAPGTPQNTWAFGMGTDDITVYAHGARLMLIPHNEYTSRYIKMWDTHRFKWYGGSIEGEAKMHNYSGTNPGIGDEGCHGIVPSTLATNMHLEGIDISGFMGDGILGSGSLQFTNYIKGSNASGYPGVSEFEEGGINDSTGANESDATKARTTVSLDVTGAAFENTRLMHPTREGRRRYQFSGSSFGGWAGMKTDRYKAYYYDASDNFLGVTEEQEFYQIYELPEGVAKVHLVIDMPYDLADIDTQLRAPVFSENLTMVNVNVFDCLRHGAANLPNNTTWRDSFIRQIGNTLPARGINIEDYRRSARNYHFENLIFQDLYGGGINLVGAVNVSITACKFLGPSYPGRNEASEYIRAIETARGRNVTISNNYIRNGIVTLGRYNVFSNNTAEGGYLQAEANGVTVKDNNFHNFEIRDAVWSNILDREPNFLEYNIFTADKDYNTALFWDRNRLWRMKGNKVFLNHKARLSFQVEMDSTYNEIVLGENTGNGIWTTTSTTNDFNQPIYDHLITGARQSLTSRDFTSSNFTLVDTYGAKYDMSVTYNGPEQDYELNDLEIDGWLEFGLISWSGTLSSPSTITLNDPYVHVDGEDFNWTNTGSNVFTTPSKNLSLVVNGGVFELNAAATVIGSSNKFIDLNNLGPNTWNGSTFRSTVNTSIPFDLTNTNIFPANLGAQTFIDCEFEGVNITMRAGDKRLFTKPHPDLEVYADNTAASAGGIPAGYMYRTSTGDVKVVY